MSRRSLRRLFLPAMVVVALLGDPAGAADKPSPADAAPCTVVGVADAARLRLACPARPPLDLRLADVRAPRPGLPQKGGEAFGDESLALSRRYLLGKRVQLAAGTALLDGEDVRRPLLAAGLVTLAPTTARPPALLQAAEREARVAGRGVWSAASWQRHRATAAEPLDLPTPEVAPPESLGARAARLSRRSPAQRQADFAAAMAEVARRPAADSARTGKKSAEDEESDDGDQ